jgi:molybdopterin converting factor small subunit
LNLTVYYFGQLGQAVGLEQEPVNCPESISLPQLLQQLVDRHGESVRRFVFDSQGQPSRSLLITINDTMVDNPSGSVLHAGDAVALLPPIAGG